MFFRKYEHKVKIGKKSLERKEVLTLLVMGYLPKVDHVTGKIISLSAVLSKLKWKYIIIYYLNSQLSKDHLKLLTI